MEGEETYSEALRCACTPLTYLNQVKGKEKEGFFFIINIILLFWEMRSVAVVTTLASKPEDPEVKSPLGPWGFSKWS